MQTVGEEKNEVSVSQITCLCLFHMMVYSVYSCKSCVSLTCCVVCENRYIFLAAIAGDTFKRREAFLREFPL